MILVFNLPSAWVSKPLVFKHFWAWRPLFLQNWRPGCSELEAGGHFWAIICPKPAF